MKLITGQILFVDERRDGVIRVDMIVLGRSSDVAAPEEAPAGAPFTLDLQQTSGPRNGRLAAAVLRTWADHQQIVDLSVDGDGGARRVTLTTGIATVTMEQSIAQR